jgi:tetratricopeptide (TPR) repeat protein
MNDCCYTSKFVRGLAILFACALLAACEEPAPTNHASHTRAAAPVKAWVKLQRQGADEYKSGDFAAAEKDLLEALPLAEADVGKDSFKLDRLLDDLGDAQRELGHHPAADVTYRRWLALREAKHGAGSIEAGHAWNRIAENWYAADEVEKARPAFEKAKSIFDKFPVGAEKDAALALHNLGAIAYSDGDYKRAEELWNKALAIRLHEYGENSMQTATTLYNLGQMTSVQERYAESNGYLNRALAAYTADEGPDHPDVALTLIALVENECIDGKDCSKIAPEQLERVLAIERRAYGEAHPQLVDPIQKLLRLYEKDKNYAAELPLRHEMVLIEVAENGENSRAAQLARDAEKRTAAKVPGGAEAAGKKKAISKKAPSVNDKIGS